jgi:hypothetical protein
MAKLSGLSRLQEFLSAFEQVTRGYCHIRFLSIASFAAREERDLALRVRFVLGGEQWRIEIA